MKSSSGSPTGIVELRPGVRDTLGRPLRDLRISVMDRCNFRCPYCMPEDIYDRDFRFLSSRERLSFPEIVRLTRLFARMGACKLRITGGEPLLRAGLADLIGDLSRLDGVEDIALTTNGVLLAQQAASLTAADKAIDIYGPWQTVLVVRLIGFVALAAVIVGRRERVRFPARAWPVLAAFGVLDTTGHLLLYTGLSLPHGEFAIVASVGYTVVTVVLARIFLREPVTPLQWGGVGLVVSGVGLLAAFG
jgi:uncharacterized membrane protein